MLDQASYTILKVATMNTGVMLPLSGCHIALGVFAYIEENLGSIKMDTSWVRAQTALAFVQIY